MGPGICGALKQRKKEKTTSKPEPERERKEIVVIDVILRDHRVLRYNLAENAIKKGLMVIIEDKKGCWIAQIPLDVIERIEAQKPCRTMKEYLRKSYRHY